MWFRTLSHDVAMFFLSHGSSRLSVCQEAHYPFGEATLMVAVHTPTLACGEAPVPNGDTENSLDPFVDLFVCLFLIMRR